MFYEKICNKCKSSLRRKGGRWCKNCHAEHMRKTRPKYFELSAEQKRKSNCRSYTHMLIKRGKIKRKPCEQCGSVHSEPHHPDYSDPRNVRWMCRECHLELHKKDGK